MTKTILVSGAALLALAGSAHAQSPTMGGGAPTMSDPAGTAPNATPSSGTPSTGITTGSAPAGLADPSNTATPPSTPDSPSAPDAKPVASDEPATKATTPPQSTPKPPRTAERAATSRAVQAEWAHYDRDGKGALTPLEFGTWVMAANNQPVAGIADGRTSKRAGLPAVKVLNATASAFARADLNKDRQVTPDELTTFLQG